MKFTVEPVWAWPLVALVVAAILATVILGYRAAVRHLSPQHRRTLLALRLVAALLLCLAMLRPAVQFHETEKDTAVLAILTDTSRSMTAQDSPGGMTRRQALLKTLAESAKQMEKLRKNVEIRFYDFSQELTPVEKPSEIANGSQTAIGAALKELLRASETKRISSAVLMSDGAQRALSPIDDDPRAVARQLASHSIPIYTIGYGASELSGSTVDLGVEDLLVDPLAFEKKMLPVSAKLRVHGAVNQELIVRMLVEDRAGKQQGESGEMKVPPATSNSAPVVRVTVKPGVDVIPVELSYVPQQPGEFKIAVEVVPVDGEVKLSNNRRDTIITVQKGGINVAYIDRPRPEQKFLREINTSDKIQLDFVPVIGGYERPLADINPQIFEPGRYDAYIIGDVPAQVFDVRNLQQLRARVDEGAGLMMIGGFRNFGAGGYADTPLADVLPVAMSTAEKQFGDEVDMRQQRTTPCPMLPTEAGLRHFLMRLDAPDRNLAQWQSLAPLKGANKLKPKSDFVEILAQTPDRFPLLFSQVVGSARVVAFAGDTTYQWYLLGHQNLHQRFWRQVILWLARKELQGDEAVWARIDPRNFSPRQRVSITMGARDARGEAISDADFSVTISGPDNRPHELISHRNGDTHVAEFAETNAPGDYWVRVSARRKGVSLGFDAWTRFIVDARDLELDNPVADLALLSEISALTGGSMRPPEQFGNLLVLMVEQGTLRQEITKYRQVTLWDNWPFVLLFVSVMSAEWFVRKRRGLA